MMSIADATRHLVLLETSGNQDFVFATNRLRENVGASELTWRAGTRFVLEAVQAAGGPDLWDDDFLKMREKISEGAEVNGIQVIIATSGKAEILVPDRETGKKIIAHATKTALTEAPGLDLCGVVSDSFDWNEGKTDKAGIAGAIGEAHRLFVEIHGQLSTPAARFPTLPVCQPCDTSGLPACTVVERGETLSRPGLEKKSAAPGWQDRLKKLLKSDETAKHWKIPNDLNKLEDDFPETDWVAIVHADGNGLGKIFLKFHQFIDGGTAADYVRELRCFSLELEAATEAAFVQALATLHEKGNLEEQQKAWRWRLPILPLLLGGDDLTVICDGRAALPFTEAFLCAFAEKTRLSPIISRIAGHQKALGKDWLSICAGVAITKPHFPFHAGYELAEELLRSAKQVKKKDLGCSALDFHILYDSVVSDLDGIRDRLWVDEGMTCLTAKPYVVDGVQKSDDEWVNAHDIACLHHRLEILRQRGDEGRPRLPRSQLHELRTGASLGVTEADARMKLIRHRYEEIDGLLESTEPPSLFRNRGDGKRETRFLDALEVAEFWPGGG